MSREIMMIMWVGTIDYSTWEPMYLVVSRKIRCKVVVTRGVSREIIIIDVGGYHRLI